MAGGEISNMATGLYAPLDVDAVYVHDAQNIWRVPRDGSLSYSLTTVFGDLTSTGTRVWVDASDVYYNEQYFGYRVPRNGGTSSTRLSSAFFTVDRD